MPSAELVHTVSVWAQTLMWVDHPMALQRRGDLIGARPNTVQCGITVAIGLT